MQAAAKRARVDEPPRAERVEVSGDDECPPLAELQRWKTLVAHAVETGVEWVDESFPAA